MKSICGLRPTGRLHLGHYFSVIEPALAGATVLVATYHAPGEKADVVPTLARFGVRNAVVLQEDVFDARLYFELLALAPAGDLGRMTQYKDSASPTAHLFCYPVLMAHDVAGYDRVLVGDDQKQHVEFAARLLRRHNRVHGRDLAVPKAGCVGGRVMDIRDPLKKMSKGRPQGCLFLDDSPEDIRRKVRRATADEAGLANLHALYKRFVGGDPPGRNDEMKSRLVEALVALLCVSEVA